MCLIKEQLQLGSRTPKATSKTPCDPHRFGWSTLQQRSETDRAPEDASGGVRRKLAICRYDRIEVLVCCGVVPVF